MGIGTKCPAFRPSPASKSAIASLARRAPSRRFTPRRAVVWPRTTPPDGIELADANAESAPALRGRCHCAAIRFEIRGEIEHLARCNCSLDIRRNAFLHYVAPDDFTLLAGEDRLATYQFGTETSRHHFCRTCGVFPFFWSNYRGNEHYAVNAGCLEGVDPYAFEPRVIDGRSF